MYQRQGQKQYSSGDLKELQRERQQSLSSLEDEPTNSPDGSQQTRSRRRRSSITISSPTLLQRRRESSLRNEQHEQQPYDFSQEMTQDTSHETLLDDEEMEVSPMPTGAERMAALRDLGATFEEGQKSIAKVATPTGTVVPSFVDSDHLEV
ncbi:hypothetical protein BDF20DRAFT_899400 [Mycotypha africana]|uniref:uncharacterized protein n=1 Tax=Mycotypha africana TaxID=64632 RepID=UPI002301D7ED|nr:uncharacterized protein BDF20DRAFT_899400 [Mycotypha africana]KAI8967807.1 hypothetical protein BDF20DRAFT_899400 [Mycotypha africana]